VCEIGGEKKKKEEEEEGQEEEEERKEGRKGGRKKLFLGRHKQSIYLLKPGNCRPKRRYY